MVSDRVINVTTYWGQGKMTPILQPTLPNFDKKKFVFWLYSVSIGNMQPLFQIMVGATNRRQDIIWINDGNVYWCLSTSLGLEELTIERRICTNSLAGRDATLSQACFISMDETLSSRSGPRLNIKTVFPWYGDSHVKDKTVARPSYL